MLTTTPAPRASIGRQPAQVIKKDAADMHGEHPVEIRRREVHEQGLMHVAGIVDRVSGIAKAVRHAATIAATSFFKRDIAAYGDRLPPSLPDLRATLAA